MRIIKRSGKEVEFNVTKIINAINGANKEVPLNEQLSQQQINQISNNVEIICRGIGHTPGVEEIQDLVENQIMAQGNYNVARKYMTYRYKRSLIRQSNTTDEQILSLLEYENEEAKQENANKNPQVASVQRDYMAGEVSKDISKRFLLPKDVWEAHEQGIIHFHDSDYFAQKIHNCFTGGTKFVTDKGVKKFNDFQNGEEVYILDLNGVPRRAIVRKYDDQKMQKVHLVSGKMEKTIICTPNHRWILSDGSVTTNLKVGERLYALHNSTAPQIETKEEAFSFCLGFVVGDGCDAMRKNNATGGTQVRLCGEKTKYKDLFIKAGYSVQSIKNTDDIMLYYNTALKQNFLNGCGWRYMSPLDKRLVFQGYYAADGAVNSNRASTVDNRIMLFIEETSAFAGYHISSKSTSCRDTEYKKDHVLTTYHFVVSNPKNMLWKVASIERYAHGNVPAWCVEEPITHSFTLEGGIVTGNCCLVNLEDMLQNGTVISDTMIEKPHSFATACNIATQAVAQIASSQYGGQTITLSHLAPFVDVSRQKHKKAVLEEQTAIGGDTSEETVNKIAEMRLLKEIQAGIQTIQYQVITLMTTNGQAPFITVYLDINEVPDGQIRKDLAICIEAALNQRILGVKNEKGVYITPAFPKLIYALDENNIHPDSEYYYLTELAAKCTAKRMVPDYISRKIMKKLKGDIYPCMGCRSFLTPDRFTDKGIGNIAKAKNYKEGEHKYYGRFNQGVVTINLPDIALSSQKDEELFWKIFDERLELCHRALRIRHERLLGTKSDVAPIMWQNGALARLDKGETIDKLLYDGYSTISLGYAGLYECVKYMKDVSHTDPEGKPFALAVMQHMNDACAKWKKEENIDYSIYGTPIESTTYKFAKNLQKRFGIIKDVTDHGYITNSYHINVRENIDAFSKLSFEAEFQALSPGGAISYVEVPNLQNNPDAVMTIIRHIYDTILYAELNTKSDYCHVCGFDGEIEIVEDEHKKLIWKCPNCGNTDQSKMNVARRTCGYIGSQFWNQGRTQEIKDRVLHVSNHQFK